MSSPQNIVNFNWLFFTQKGIQQLQLCQWHTKIPAFLPYQSPSNYSPHIVESKRVCRLGTLKNMHSNSWTAISWPPFHCFTHFSLLPWAEPLSLLLWLLLQWVPSSLTTSGRAENGACDTSLFPCPSWTFCLSSLERIWTRWNALLQ